MSEEERTKIISKIDKNFYKELNLFQIIGWKILEHMWNSLFNDSNY